MTLINRYRSGAKHRSTAGVLADIAHELSSPSDWTRRVEDALSMLCDVIPTHTAALGIQTSEWTTYYYTDPEDPDELEDRLLRHYALLTGRAPGASGDEADIDTNSIGIISESESDMGSFLSLPVIGGGQVIGVLHVCVDENDAYSPEDVSVLSIVPLQIGSYVTNVQAQLEAQMRAREMETLRDEAEYRRAELESFISSTADGVVLFNTEGRVLLINEMVKNLLNPPADLPFDDWVKRYELRTVHGEPVPIDEYPSRLALKGETTRDARFKMVTPWKESTVSISASPVKDSEGQLIGGVLSFHDVSRLVELERQTQEDFDREHRIAQMLQQALIPSQVQNHMEGTRIAVKYQPALKEAEVGGDFYDVFRLGDGRVGILIGDVAGKGLQAAIRVAAVRYAVRSYAYLDSSPGVVMTLVNELLCRDEPGGEGLLTAIYAVVDSVDRNLTYASGGHEPALVRKSDGQIEELSDGGRALGVYGGYTYTETSRAIGCGETIVIVTDGITEARSGNVLFGQEGVKEFLKSHSELSPSQTASGLLDAATAHASGPLQDDAAIVVLELDKPATGTFDSRARV